MSRNPTTADLVKAVRSGIRYMQSYKAFNLLVARLEAYEAEHEAHILWRKAYRKPGAMEAFNALLIAHDNAERVKQGEM